MKINVYCIIIILVFFSCKEKKKLEYIEITTGVHMDPSEPRIGIYINNNDSLYFCKEIVNNKGRTGSYKYYKFNDKINFSRYRNQVLKEFNKPFLFRSIIDEQPKQISYSLEKVNYKQKFYFNQLNSNQKKAYNDIVSLILEGNFIEISNYNFSQNLLYQKNQPEPPAQSLPTLSR